MIDKSLPDIASDPDVVDLLKRALAEDFGEGGDVTSSALVPADRRGRGSILSVEQCIVAGTGIADAVFRMVDDSIEIETLIGDGNAAEPEDVIMIISGPAGSIMSAERTALNFMQRMCGIATLTSRFVSSIAQTGAVILDTRKTTPCLRRLEKYAVLCGGGTNHRMGLYDRVLIKDNHRRMVAGDGGVSCLEEAVKAARAKFPELQVEVEVEDERELDDALKAGPDWVLLDNMPVDKLAAMAARCKGLCKTEASGGVTLETAGAIAQTGVDAISVGALTHSAPAVDLSLELEPE